MRNVVYEMHKAESSQLYTAQQRQCKAEKRGETMQIQEKKIALILGNLLQKEEEHIRDMRKKGKKARLKSVGHCCWQLLVLSIEHLVTPGCAVGRSVAVARSRTGLTTTITEGGRVVVVEFTIRRKKVELDLKEPANRSSKRPVLFKQLLNGYHRTFDISNNY